MTALEDRYNRLVGKGHSTERLEFFSDAVFAIAMTLLVIELKVPQDGRGTTWDVIVSQIPAFLAFALSFWIIGVNWASHHRKFRLIREYNGRLVMLNLGMLFLVALAPFPTSLLSEYPLQTASVVLYAASVGGMSFMQWVLWTYAYRAGLVLEEVDEQMYRYIGWNILPVPIVFFASIPIAFIDPHIAAYFWIVLWPFTLVMGKIQPKPRSAKTA
jgi:uncharacterized membrane protein